jgi:hypothetical protein
MRMAVQSDEFPRDVLYDTWLIKAPNGDVGSITSPRHSVELHADGTISITHCIAFRTGALWHGYLTRGRWRQSS